jgi:hypothetical protein
MVTEEQGTKLEDQQLDHRGKSGDKWRKKRWMKDKTRTKRRSTRSRDTSVGIAPG